MPHFFYVTSVTMYVDITHAHGEVNVIDGARVIDGADSSTFIIIIMS